MGTKQLTPDGLSAQIASLNSHLADLEGDASTLALAAAEGDADAAKKIASVNAEIERVKADRVILIRAREAAAARAAEVDTATKATQRAKHMADAGHRAKEVVVAAQAVDLLADQLRQAIKVLNDAESSVWASLRFAGEMPPGSVRFRRGISTHALDALKAIGEGREIFRHDKRSTAEIAAVAWEFLLEADELERVA